jgi:hypothetical protein
MLNEITDVRAKRLRSKIPARDFYCAVVALMLATALHAYLLASEIARPVDELEILRSPFLPRALWLVWLCLIVSTVALWTRRLAGLLVSMFGLIGVLGTYLLWYINSDRVVKSLLIDPFYYEHPEAVPSSMLGLVGASGWNVVVLALAGLLLIWETKTFVGMRRAS